MEVRVRCSCPGCRQLWPVISDRVFYFKRPEIHISPRYKHLLSHALPRQFQHKHDEDDDDNDDNDDDDYEDEDDIGDDDDNDDDDVDDDDDDDDYDDDVDDVDDDDEDDDGDYDDDEDDDDYDYDGDYDDAGTNSPCLKFSLREVIQFKMMIWRTWHWRQL